MPAGLHTALPKLRKTVLNKLALAVGAMIEAQTLNTIELANVLPLPTEQGAGRSASACCLRHWFVPTPSYGEAEPLYQRALAICEQALGPAHPSTATVRANYAEPAESNEALRNSDYLYKSAQEGFV
jgi:hypothetical protein